MNQYSAVDHSTVHLIFENGIVEDVRKGDVIFHQKKFNGFEYFQFSGISHRFNIDENQDQVTSGIYMDDTVITPHFTRTPDSQSLFSLQALTDVVYLKIPAGMFRDLSEKHFQIKMFGRAVVEREFVRNLHFEALFRSFTAKDRLIYFRANYPNLENMIPHSIIASFLGITPVSFSRLRNELSRQ